MQQPRIKSRQPKKDVSHSSNSREDLTEIRTDAPQIREDVTEDPEKADPTDVTEDPEKADLTDVTVRAATDAMADPVSIVLLLGTEMFPADRARARAADLSVTETSSREDRSPSVTDAAAWAVLTASAIRIRMMTDVSLLQRSVLLSLHLTAS